MKRSKGFTLVELMIVIVIIGVLASIAIPQLTKATSKAAHSEAMNVTDRIRNSVAEFYGYRGRLPLSHEELGLPEPDSIYGRYVNRVVYDSGSITVTFNNSRPELQSDTVFFRSKITLPQKGTLISWDIEHIYTDEFANSEVGE